MPLGPRGDWSHHEGLEATGLQYIAWASLDNGVRARTLHHSWVHVGINLAWNGSDYRWKQANWEKAKRGEVEELNTFECNKYLVSH
jgi:hypothetical protein